MELQSDETAQEECVCIFQLRGSRLGKVNIDCYLDRALIYSVWESLCELHKFAK